MIFVGNDWSEDHHDVWVMDDDGHKLAWRRFPEGVEGVSEFHALIAEFVSDPSEVVIGIETDRGLWVNALVAADYLVFAINPKSMSRYRDRHRVSGGKSDTSDAKVLADAVRTDRHNHRPVAGDTSRVHGIKALARAHQNLIWERTRATNRLRSTLREYYPAALATFSEDLGGRDTLAVLAVAASPIEGASLTRSQIRAALKRGGRRRYLNDRTETIRAGLRQDQISASEQVTAAMAAITRAQVAIISELNTQISGLETELENHFEQHPDAPIYLSMPGISDVLGARILGEFGDDPDRYADAKSRRNYAATSPITIASGKTEIVAARWIRNNRLYDAAMQWAFCSITASPGCRAFYDQRRANHDTHRQAIRALANRLVGILHGCLRTKTRYDEHTAWGHRQTAAA